MIHSIQLFFSILLQLLIGNILLERRIINTCQCTSYVCNYVYHKTIDIYYNLVQPIRRRERTTIKTSTSFFRKNNNGVSINKWWATIGRFRSHCVEEDATGARAKNAESGTCCWRRTREVNKTFWCIRRMVGVHMQKLNCF